MKRLTSLVLPVAIVFAVVLGFKGTAHAVNPSDLIDDGVFTKTGSMSPTDINNLLNSYSASCLSPNNTGAAWDDPLGYSGGAYQFGPKVTAGQAIYDISQHYNVNPQVIITTLQKEQSVVTGSAGCHFNTPDPSQTQNSPCGSAKTPCTSACPYSGGCVPIAMSYACPNYCYAGIEGFSKQLSGGTWVLRWAQQRAYGNLTGYAGYDSGDEAFTYTGPMTAGFRKTSSNDAGRTYDGTWTTSDGTSINVSNGATASLYTYTPFLSGNTNFDNLWTSTFNFGSLFDYLWQFVSQSSSTGSFVLYAGQSATFTLRAKNTGSVTWSNSTNPVRLATWNPPYSRSPFDPGDWLSTYRPATLTEPSVAPGAIGTFTFDVKMPATPGQYNERFNLVSEGAAWFVDPGVEFDVVVRPVNYAWQMVSQSSSTGSFVLAPGQAATFTLVAKNTGDLAWSNSTNPVRLATWAPSYRTSVFNDGSWVSSTRAATLTEASVAPGATGTFTFNVKAPTTQGFYIERFNLVQEGTAWFTDPWVEFDVKVQRTLTWQMVSQSSSTGSFVLNRGQSATFTLVAKNTGNVTWNNSSNPVRLATWAPSYRTSVFNDGSWVNQFRAATLTEASVAPGANGTFTFNVKAPSSAGFYVERFNLVMEGVDWFTDPWMEFDVKVQ